MVKSILLACFFGHLFFLGGRWLPVDQPIPKENEQTQLNIEALRESEDPLTRIHIFNAVFEKKSDDLMKQFRTAFSVGNYPVARKIGRQIRANDPNNQTIAEALEIMERAEACGKKLGIRTPAEAREKLERTLLSPISLHVKQLRCGYYLMRHAPQFIPNSPEFLTDDALRIRLEPTVDPLNSSENEE